MIGSGIFIVSADIARGVQSPALLIGAWLVTAVMTLTGALAYGEARRDDAEGWRAIRLPARVTRPPVGLSLWLDALSRHPERNDRWQLA